MTYGNYKSLSGIPSMNNVVLNTREYRKNGIWCTSHLRTYKAWLFNKIKRDDFLDQDGNIFKVAGDVAIMYPLIEMCGNRHINFINIVMYIYNDLNDLNEFRVEPDLMASTVSFIKGKKEYEEIK
jgi:hypothetical protein